jgi:hypothetical protein
MWRYVMQHQIGLLLKQFGKYRLSVDRSYAIGWAGGYSSLLASLSPLYGANRGLLGHGAALVAQGTRIPRSLGLQATKVRGFNKRVVYHAALVERLLSRFLVALWGGSVFIFIARNVQRRLLLAELAFIYLQGQRIFARMPASAFQVRHLDNYPWRYGAAALYIAVMLRDPSLLVRWLQPRIRVMTLFQHRKFFRTLALTLQTSVLSPQERYVLRGFHLYLVGKISVTGNAMSRAYTAHAGQHGNATLTLRRVTSFTIVRTRTGCLGLTLTFCF